MFIHVSAVIVKCMYIYSEGDLKGQPEHDKHDMANTHLSVLMNDKRCANPSTTFMWKVLALLPDSSTIG